jgi:hypothetical protein
LIFDVSCPIASGRRGFNDPGFEKAAGYEQRTSSLRKKALNPHATLQTLCR